MTLQAITRHALLTPEEVSALLKIPTTTLAVWRSTGRVKLRYVKVGRAVRYSAADVEALITGALPTT
jgi:excisionase family DNA binding protein